MRILKIFVVANVTVITAMMLLPVFLITQDMSVIDELVNYLGKENS